MNTEQEDIDKEKKEIAKHLELHKEEIMEVDEAAGSAEGLKNRESDSPSSVEEDREQVDDTAVDVPESDIIQ